MPPAMELAIDRSIGLGKGRTGDRKGRWLATGWRLRWRRRAKCAKGQKEWELAMRAGPVLNLSEYSPNSTAKRCTLRL